MVKHTLTFLLLMFFLPALTALDIVCSSYPVWLLTRPITFQVPGVRMQLMQQANSGCSHSYTPTPQDMRKVTHPDTVLICNAPGMDGHIAAAAGKVNPSLRIIFAADNIKKQDDHTFASPDTAKFMCIKIAAELSRLDPDNQELYQRNADKFISQLDELIRQAQTLPSPGRYAVLPSSIFINLATLCRCRFIMLRHEKSSPMRPGSMIKALKDARKYQAYSIWQEHHSHDDAVKIFARESRLTCITLDPLLSGPTDPPADYYIIVMRRNLETIRRSLEP